jgi:hypothetical protein
MFIEFQILTVAIIIQYSTCPPLIPLLIMISINIIVDEMREDSVT